MSESQFKETHRRFLYRGDEDREDDGDERSGEDSREEDEESESGVGGLGPSIKRTRRMRNGGGCTGWGCNGGGITIRREL